MERELDEKNQELEKVQAEYKELKANPKVSAAVPLGFCVFFLLDFEKLLGRVGLECIPITLLITFQSSRISSMG